MNLLVILSRLVSIWRCNVLYCENCGSKLEPDNYCPNRCDMLDNRFQFNYCEQCGGARGINASELGDQCACGRYIYRIPDKNKGSRDD
jgi:hypothetical protein